MRTTRGLSALSLLRNGGGGLRLRRPFTTALQLGPVAVDDADEPAPAPATKRRKRRRGKPVIDISKEKRFLYRRISQLGDQKLSAADEIEQWRKEGRELQKSKLARTTAKLRASGRYKHALDVSEWMEDTRGFRLGKYDFGVRLDLISKVHGIASAEKYFKKLPEEAKNCYSYGAVLNSYVREGMVEEAEQLMERMKELNFVTNAVPYNNIMTLHFKRGEPEKVLPLIEEMKANGIKPDKFTYNIWMKSAAALSGTSAAKEIFEEVKNDPSVWKDWTTWSNLATIYIDAGDTVSAKPVLEEMEKKMSYRRLVPHNFLLTMYASIGEVGDVHRVWTLIMSRFSKRTSISYICLLTSLVKLGDIKGAEKYFRKYESENLHYNFRVPNILLEVYIKEGKMDKAEDILKRGLQKGGKPTFKTWDMFVGGYLEKNKMDIAIETMKKALSKVKPLKWMPDPKKVQAIQRYLEELGDVERAEDMFRRLRQADYVNVDTYNSLIRTCIQAKKSPRSVVDRMKLDKVDPNSETDSLVEKTDTT